MMEDNKHARCIIVDFYCHEYRLIIEIDGWIHNIPEVLELDREKEELLWSQWFQIHRFTNQQVNSDMIFVLDSIKSKYIT